MNFFEGELVQNGGLCFRMGEAMLEMEPCLAGRLGGHEGPAVLGVRPESLSTVAEGRYKAARNALQVSVGVTEPMGEKMDVYATVQGRGRIVARLDSRVDVRAGMALPLYVDMSRVHVFECSGAGEALC
jgi:ABC-type sugar transport system ATPase subunit